MNVFHIGTIAFETADTKRELKSIGGISGYIIELINYSLSKGIRIGFIGKIYNYSKNKNLSYIQVQNKVTSTNKFLIHLLYKSLITKLPPKAIIHAHRPDHLAAFIIFNNRPSVISLHGQQAHTVNVRKGKLIRTIYQVLEKYAVKKAKALIAVDPITKDFYSKLYPKYQQKIHTIPTGVNTNVFYSTEKSISRKKLGFKESDKIIIYVGRIEPPKRIDIIIEALRLIVQKDNNYKMVLVGDGVLMDDMKSLSSNLNLNDNIYFMGVRKRNELPLLFNSADVSVLISDNEGSPLSVKESLACGIPVVANAVGDISELIKDSHNGFIINKNDIHDIANKLQLSIQNTKVFKQNCIDSIKSYTISHVSDDVIKLYNKILNEQ